MKKDRLDDALDRSFIWLIIGATSIYSGLWLATRAAKGTFGLWRWFVGRGSGTDSGRDSGRMGS